MPSRRRKKPSGKIEIPVSSFADVAFLLIIFFILVTTLQKTMGVLTDLPTGQKSEQKPEKTPTIKLHGGKTFLNDDEVAPPNLRARLEEMKLHDKAGEDKVILLEATGKVPYQQYFEVMTAVAKAGGVLAIVREEGNGQP